MEKDKESITLNIEDESQDYVGHIIIHENPESPVTTPPATPPEPTDAMSDNDSATSDDSAYDADTICDSPTSTSSTLDLNPAEHSNDETEVGEASGEPSLQCHENFDEARTLFFPRYKLMSYPNAFQLPPTRARNVIMCGAGMKCLKFKPLIHGGRFDRDSDSDTDYSDMPPLEETKKNKEDSTDESEVGDVSSDSNEPHGIIRNVDENDLLFFTWITYL